MEEKKICYLCMHKCIDKCRYNKINTYISIKILISVTGHVITANTSPSTCTYCLAVLYFICP